MRMWGLVKARMGGGHGIRQGLDSSDRKGLSTIQMLAKGAPSMGHAGPALCRLEARE